MSKLRSDSKFSALTLEQKQKLHSWLFEENLALKEIQKRVLEEFGLACSACNLSVYLTRERTQRSAEVLSSYFNAVPLLNKKGEGVERLRSGIMKLIAKRALDNAFSDGDAKDLASLSRVLLESQEREIQQGRLELARRRFEFRAARAVLKVLPLAAEMKRVDDEHEDQKIRTITQSLFGPYLPETNEQNLG